MLGWCGCGGGVCYDLAFAVVGSGFLAGGWHYAVGWRLGRWKAAGVMPFKWRLQQMWRLFVVLQLRLTTPTAFPLCHGFGSDSRLVFPRRWLEDDSDEDEGAGGSDGGKEGTEGSGGEEEERGQDPPGSADDPQPAPPPPRGQSAQEDTGVVAARALSDPTGRRECPRSPPPFPPALPDAAAQSPVSPASTAAAAALHSLARGTSRHPHHTAAPHHRSPPLARPRLADREAAIGDGLCVRAADKARTTFLTPIDETELDSTCEDSSVVVDETLAVTESAKVKDSVLSEARVPRVNEPRGLEALTPRGTPHTSVPSTAEAMVARTDPNQGGKVGSCPDDLQSLSMLALQGKQEMDASLLSAMPAVATAPLHLASQDSEGAASAMSSGDAASDVPSTPSTFCSDGEEHEDLEDEGRSSEDTPEPPDYSTHPELTGK